MSAYYVFFFFFLFFCSFSFLSLALFLSFSASDMSALEFDGYGLGDDKAVAYSKALAVHMPPELAVRSLSLRNNRLTGKGAVSILNALRDVGTVTGV